MTKTNTMLLHIKCYVINLDVEIYGIEFKIKETSTSDNVAEECRPDTQNQSDYNRPPSLLVSSLPCPVIIQNNININFSNSLFLTSHRESCTIRMFISRRQSSTWRSGAGDIKKSTNRRRLKHCQIPCQVSVKFMPYHRFNSANWTSLISVLYSKLTGALNSPRTTWPQ